MEVERKYLVEETHVFYHCSSRERVRKEQRKKKKRGVRERDQKRMEMGKGEWSGMGMGKEEMKKIGQDRWREGQNNGKVNIKKKMGWGESFH